ncbi:MAG TPA: hypothetical protein VGD17_03195 [Chitinophagaceae bacterium]
MMLQKEDLMGDYEWVNENGFDAYTGDPSRRKFDRFNGNQVLFLINSYASIVERFSINEGRKLESLVINHLPLEMKSEISVFNWLRKILNIIPEEKITFIKSETLK